MFSTFTGLNVPIPTCNVTLAIFTPFSSQSFLLADTAVRIFPALSSMRICKHYKCTVIVAAVVSIIAFLTGILLSFAFDIPAGAAVVLTNLTVFVILSLVGKVKQI